MRPGRKLSKDCFEIELLGGQSVYFASDFHLGIPNKEKSKEREQKIVRWLDSISENSAAIILVGDLFDFWFEYKHVIPKGFVRLQGKIAELSDKGIPIFIFTGNHDLWMGKYFDQELGVATLTNPVTIKIRDKLFYVGHGDGLGPGERHIKFLKKIFTGKLFQWQFRWFHPDLGISVANYWSRKSRQWDQKKEDIDLGEKEPLFNYCQQVEKSDHHDYYIFGHRHLPVEMKVNEQAIYFNLGEWVFGSSYVEYNGEKATIKNFSS